MKTLIILSLLAIACSSKIESNLQKILETKGVANVILQFPTTGSSKVLQTVSNLKFNSRGSKLSWIRNQLKQVSDESQEPLSNFLESQNIKFIQLWATNQLSIQNANFELLKTLLEKFPQVLSISEDRKIPLNRPKIEGRVARSPIETKKWGVDKIQAGEALELLESSNISISEVRVLSVSTGARRTHETLVDNFLGDYGWFDPYGVSNDEPIDEFGVGSHETAIMVGSEGYGVFPHAKWMSCRACQVVDCATSTIMKCAEFALCPTRTDDTDPNCDMAPHILHMDWWNPPPADFFDYYLELLAEAGILVVFPNGGAGPECGTVRYPADHPLVMGVGGTTTNDSSYDRSSVGPTIRNVIKPEISGPGENVESAAGWSDDEYWLLSGTSMSSSHAVGVIALLKAVEPSLTFTETVRALAFGAEQNGLQTDTRTCGGIPSTNYPNNIYGHGRLSALNSLRYLIATKK